VFITHNPHHAHPVGDRFVVLNRGRLLGDYAKDEIGRDELVRLMSGGAELETLGHELERIPGIVAPTEPQAGPAPSEGQAGPVLDEPQAGPAPAEALDENG